MSQQPHRVRVRFAKQGHLRLLSHRDLVRAMERLFRRMGVELALSQGFHPRPLMTFPDALSLGIAADNEVMDVSFNEAVAAEDLHRRMAEQAPEGLVIHNVRVLGPQERKVKISRVHYGLQLPDTVDFAVLKPALEEFLQRETLTVQRKDKQVQLDLTESLEGLGLDDDRLTMTIRVTSQSQLQPRDILAELGLSETLRAGAILTRTDIEIIP